MKKTMIIKLGFLILMVGSFWMYLSHTGQAIKSQEAYEEARELAQNEIKEPMISESMVSEAAKEEETDTEEVTEEELGKNTDPVYGWQEIPVVDDPHMERLSAISLETLREKNPDVVGWIEIPDTKLSYPLMAGTEDNYYLDHTWEKTSSVAGSVFVEFLCSDELEGFNTVIYGHRMKNDTMFGSLKYYKDSTYWEKHPYVYVCNDTGVHRYEIFAAYEATLQGSTYQIGFADDASKQDFLDNCAEYSDLKTDVTPTIHDRVLTLSTCTGRGYESRWVVQACCRGCTTKSSLAGE